MARVPPRTPADALASFEVANGFRMQLVAAEPLVADPVAAAFDENGLLYVVEMHGYPYERERNEPPSGVVRVLEDADGDGAYDKSERFVDGLTLPTGIAVWDGGVFVAAAPDIWYFKDKDGDRKADVKRRVYTGFGVDNVQALVNNLQWGLDNRLHGASASNGGLVRPVEKPDAPAINLRGRDFCFDPRSEILEPESGTAQFGNALDDWGNRFVCSNSEHAQQIVLPNRYLERNPHVAVAQVLATIAKEGGAPPIFRISPAEPWRVVRTARRMNEGFAKTGPLVEHDVFTSATGITIYRGEAYPSEYRGNLFVGEVQGNLVHRKTLVRDGAIFRAVRADPETECIRSRDTWFRPVNFVNAPDGTLFVLDMYRETVEHPHSIPDDIEAHLDMSSGKDRGRIYRLAPPQFTHPKPPRLSSATVDQLVDVLAHPSGWWRDTAQRLLVERRAQSAAAPLRVMLRAHPSALARLHAISTLAGLGELTDRDVLTGLADAEAGIRVQALRLCEPKLERSRAITDRVLELAHDRELHVRLQTAFTLGESQDPRIAGALSSISRRDGADEWMACAVLSSSTQFAATMIDSLVTKVDDSETSLRRLTRALAVTVGARHQADEVRRFFKSMENHSDSSLAPVLLAGFAEGLSRSGQRLAHYADRDSASGKLLAAMLARAAQYAASSDLSPDRRREAIELLALDDFVNARRTLAELLSPRQPHVVQLAAMRALNRYPILDVADILLREWGGYSPAVRDEAMEILLGRQIWRAPFVDAVASGIVTAAHVPPSRREQLIKDADPAVRSKAAMAFASVAVAPRTLAIARMRPALRLAGDRTRGEKVFVKSECIACHKLAGKGFDVGPNLATVGNRTPEALLEQIIDPNREVLPNYLEYTVALIDGRIATGIIVAESATSITIRRAQNNESTILRSDIEAMRSSGKSLMPEGLEQKLTPQDAADLVEFLLSVRR